MTIEWDEKTIMVDDFVECYVGKDKIGSITYLHCTKGHRYCFVGSSLDDVIKTAKKHPFFYED